MPKSCHSSCLIWAELMSRSESVPERAPESLYSKKVQRLSPVQLKQQALHHTTPCITSSRIKEELSEMVEN